MPTLPTTPKPTNAAGDDSWLLDENLSPALVQGSMRDLHISDSPVVGPLRATASANSSSAASGISALKKPIKSRPSWGSAAVLDANNSAKSMSKMRLLAGLDGNDENKPPVSRRGPTSGASGGADRPRFSLFAKPGVPTNLMPKKAQQQAEPEDDEDDLTIAGLPDSSLFASSSSAIDPEHPYLREALSGTRATSSNLFPSTVAAPTAVESKETSEQSARQLTELRRMNDVFESFERMLRGSAGQINAFAKRVKETDDLLNIYIDLLRQTEKTQQLLQDQDWKGTSEDASAHALSVALAERETQRLRVEAQAREEEQRRAAEEEARREEEAERRRQEEQRRAATGGVRGRGRVVSGSTRGTARGGTVRGASTAATRGRAVSGRSAGSADPSAPARSTTAPVSTRGATTATRGRTASATGRGTARPSGIPTRSTSGSSGLGGQYANVKSSGYGPK